MKNKKLEELNQLIQAFLIKECGYCGAAVSDKSVMLNSGNGNQNWIITIEDKTEKEKESE